MGDGIEITTYIINSFIILITFYLIFLYLKSKEFHQYQCYNIIILSIIIFLDNILRLIPMDIFILKHIQAFILTFFDKLILIIITSQALIIYLGVCQTKLYYKKEKIIFIVSLIIGLVISIVLSILYIIFADKENEDGGITNYNGKSMYFYVSGTDFKILSDSLERLRQVMINRYLAHTHRLRHFFVTHLSQKSKSENLLTEWWQFRFNKLHQSFQTVIVIHAVDGVLHRFLQEEFFHSFPH